MLLYLKLGNNVKENKVGQPIYVFLNFVCCPPLKYFQVFEKSQILCLEVVSLRKHLMPCSHAGLILPLLSAAIIVLVWKTKVSQRSKRWKEWKCFSGWNNIQKREVAINWKDHLGGSTEVESMLTGGLRKRSIHRLVCESATAIFGQFRACKQWWWGKQSEFVLCASGCESERGRSDWLGEEIGCTNEKEEEAGSRNKVTGDASFGQWIVGWLKFHLAPLKELLSRY